MSDLVSVVKDMGVGDAIVYIADKIGISVQHMYEIILHAQVTIAIINTMLMVIWCLIVAVTSIIAYRAMVKPYLEKHYEIGVHWFIMFLLTCIVALIALVALSVLQSSLVAIFCPEYSALREMLYTFKNIL